MTMKIDAYYKSFPLKIISESKIPQIRRNQEEEKEFNEFAFMMFQSGTCIRLF